MMKTRTHTKQVSIEAATLRTVMSLENNASRVIYRQERARLDVERTEHHEEYDDQRPWSATVSTDVWR